MSKTTQKFDLKPSKQIFELPENSDTTSKLLLNKENSLFKGTIKDNSKIFNNESLRRNNVPSNFDNILTVGELQIIKKDLKLLRKQIDEREFQ